MLDKILVTGATGFIGSNLVRKLVETHDEIHILTRPSSDLWRLSDIFQRVHNHHVDLTQPVELKEIIQGIRPDYIFHLANAGIYGGISVPDEDMVKTNLVGFINLNNALEGVEYRGFINVGSSSEYGLRDTPMREDSLCEPMNVYGISKLAATHYATLMARTRNKPIATFRLFSPFGSYDDHRRLISKVILDILNGREVKLANPKAVRDYIFIEDVVDLFLEARDKISSLGGEVFNVGSGQEHRISEVVEIIIKQMKPDMAIEWGTGSTSPWESRKWEADMTKTISIFNWGPKYSLGEGIKKTIDWFRQNKNLYEGNRYLSSF